MAGERIHIGNGMLAMCGQNGLNLVGLEKHQLWAYFTIHLERNNNHVQKTLEEALLYYGIEKDQRREELRDRFNAVALGQRAVANSGTM